MHTIKTHISFQLVPLNVEQKAETKPASDNWLENDSIDLLNDEAFSSVNDASKSDTPKVEKPNALLLSAFHLEINDSGLHFKFDGQDHAVKADEIIEWQGQYYQVKLSKQPVVAIDKTIEKQPAVQLASKRDVWAAAENQLAMQNNRFADPFTSRTSVAHNQDPLDFLYGNTAQPQVQPREQSQTINDYFPQDEALPTVHFEQAPQHNEGDILRDLGIDDSTSTIMQQRYQEVPGTYAEQSPLDHLEQTLDTQNNVVYSEPYQPSQAFPQADYQSQASCVDSSVYQAQPGVLSVLKKWVGR